jgi:hypothetical protein
VPCTQAGPLGPAQLACASRRCCGAAANFDVASDALHTGVDDIGLREVGRTVPVQPATVALSVRVASTGPPLI